MQIKITPKTAGNSVNVRKGQTGKAHSEIVRTEPDGAILDAETTKAGKYYKVSGGYVLAELAVVVDEDPAEAEPATADDE